MKKVKEMTEEEIYKKLESITISNDFLFSAVMRDKEICKELIENLLQIKIGNIKYIEEQKTINTKFDAKSVRLDVYVQEENKIYNIEMQVTNDEELPKRSRYYQSLIDSDAIKKGERYRELKETYIIFICTFDPFGKDLPKYVFENYCEQDKNLKLNDKAYKIFFNTKASEKEKDENIQAFLNFVEGKNVENNFVEKLRGKVKEVKDSSYWRKEYMTLEMRERETLEKGREEGRIEGRIEGKIEGRVEALKELNYSDKEIIEIVLRKCNTTEEEIKKYL